MRPMASPAVVKTLEPPWSSPALRSAPVPLDLAEPAPVPAPLALVVLLVAAAEALGVVVPSASLPARLRRPATVPGAGTAVDSDAIAK
jgi:hypothetical protein